MYLIHHVQRTALVAADLEYFACFDAFDPVEHGHRHCFGRRGITIIGFLVGRNGFAEVGIGVGFGVCIGIGIGVAPLGVGLLVCICSGVGNAVVEFAVGCGVPVLVGTFEIEVVGF